MATRKTTRYWKENKDQYTKCLCYSDKYGLYTETATLLIKLGFPIGTSKLLSSPILDMEVLHIIALLYNSAIDEF